MPCSADREFDEFRLGSPQRLIFFSASSAVMIAGPAPNNSGLIDIVKTSQSQGRSQCLYIAHRGLSEEALVLPIELAWTFVSRRERRTCSIKFLCEHLLPSRMEPK